VAQLRRARPGLALSTDIIVGFPGETEEDFQCTLELVREVRFASVYAFLYSPRPGTAAPRLDGEVERETAAERLQRLFALEDGIQRELNRELVGQEHGGGHPDRPHLLSPHRPFPGGSGPRSPRPTHPGPHRGGAGAQSPGPAGSVLDFPLM
jgi:tRNA-2-methylthio-N6-dimethylallyladenosine synthase